MANLNNNIKTSSIHRAFHTITPIVSVANQLIKRKLYLLAILLNFVIIYPVIAQISRNPFLINFKDKIAVIPPYRESQKPTTPPTVVVSVNAKDVLAPVSPYIYGTNSTPRIGNIDKNKKLLRYLNHLSPNLIRLPGGSGSDLFFWDASPGHMPPGVPDSVWIGRQKKWVKHFARYGHGSKTFPLDGYYSMLKKTNSMGMITVNYGYARYGKTKHPIQQAAHYAADWVRYDDGRTKYWEIGNEDYGRWEAGYLINTKTNKDGQPKIDNGQLYGKIAKVFIDSMRMAAQDVGAKIFIGTQIYVKTPEKHDVAGKTWNAGYFKSARNIADFYIQHNYFTIKKNEAPIPILNSVKAKFTAVDQYFPREIKALGGEPRPIAMSEWNIRATGSKQTTSFINGIHAAMVLGELAERPFYGEASRWDIANPTRSEYNLGMFKAGKINQRPVGVQQWNPFPVYFYMYYFQKFFGDHVIHSTVQGSNNVIAYASSFGSGQLGIVVVNIGDRKQTVKLKTSHFAPGKRYFIYSLTGGNDNPPFSQKVYVNGVGPDNTVGGPIKDLENLKALSSNTKGGIEFDSPAMSVQYVLIQADQENK